jgi:hypothetical protein
MAQQQRRRGAAAIGRRQNPLLLLLLLLLAVLSMLAVGARAAPRDRDRERERQSERRSSRGSSSSTSGSRQDRAGDAKAKDVKAPAVAANETPSKDTAPQKPAPPPTAAAPAPPPKKAPPPPPPPPPELPSYARNTSAYAWTGAGSPSFTSYPEVTPGQPWSMPRLLERPALAVALGSGGARAAPLALGWARALARMGVMSHARHLAATSASAWVAAPYAYQSAAGGDDAFFGPWLPPEHLGPAAADLQRTLSPGSFGAAVAGKGVMPIGGALGALLPGGSSASDPSGAITRWTSGVATVFLEPFGLASVAPPTAVGTLSSNSSSRAAAALKGAQGGVGSAADGPFLFDAIRATRDGGLLGLFGAALGGGSGGSAAGASSSSGRAPSAAPTFDPARGGGRPFPIIAASVVTPLAGIAAVASSSSSSSSSSPSPSSADNNNRLLWRPFEMTPLYSGLPVAGVPAAADPKLLSGVLVENLGGNSRVRPSFANATKEAAQRRWGAEMAQKQEQGGSAVAAANANATAIDLFPKRPADLPFLSSSPAGGPVELLLQAPAARDAPPLSLAAALGGASSDPSLATNGGKDRDSLQEAYLASPGSLTGQWLDLADGSATDSTAITAALRRKPTHLVACLSTKEGPEKTAGEWASAEPGVAALFGATGAAPPSSSSSSSSSSARLHPSQVFARADYEKFFAALRRAWLRPLDNPSDVPGFKEGVASPLRPGTLQAARTVAPVFRTRHSVLPNPKAGVPGGHDVEVLWVVNARAGAWESRLPVEVRTLVQGARGVLGSPTADFPYLPHAVSSALSTEAFVLLSQQADWQLREASDRVVEFVADAQAEHARARYLSEARAAGLGVGGGKA